MSDEKQVVVAEAEGLVKAVQEFKITNIAGVKQGCEFLARFKAASNKIEEVLGPVKKQAYKTYQEAIKLYNTATKDIKQADGEIRGAITSHLDTLKNVPEDLPDGVSVSARWKVDEVDIKALCLAVANGEVSPELVEPNVTALNKLATSMKGFMNVAGVKVKETKSVSIRIQEINNED